MPERIQRQRTKGWRMPEGAIYVGRPTVWGNPWSERTLLFGPHVYRRPPLDAPAPTDYEWGPVSVSITPTLAVALYRAWIAEEGRTAIVREHLRGLDLVCWCPLDAPCHATVLLEVANAG